MVRIIGIDPGTNKTGWAVIEKINDKYKLLDSGVINNQKFKNYNQKLANLALQINKLMDQYFPDKAIIEDSYVNNNNRSSLILSETRGAIKMLFINAGLEVQNITPREVKINITGNGAACKQQIAKMIEIFTGKQHISSDQNDAIAIALSE